ncbi:DUF192 domain-containing protein [Sphingomonas naasensis]|uniref:DUF192 domain-containing protein n=2 Tax=Sphingomonas naasensis TaxID=1344951 RepID=A0A4V3QV76_9SPHN|nr:DUF192 domain-containing protein [Sphingomonas naasensis]
MRAAFVAAVLLVSTACNGAPGPGIAAEQAPAKVLVTIDTKAGPRKFNVEVARTTAEQERGLMFRTNLPADGGMLFAPYPPEGPPREASFWMKNTPSPLDILFIRSDGTIAKIAENAVPYSEQPLRSGEPVGAVLEINGGKAAELGIAPGDKVRWTDENR